MADLLKRLSAEAQKYATAGPPHIRDLLLEAEGEMTELIETLRMLRAWAETVRRSRIGSSAPAYRAQQRALRRADDALKRHGVKVGEPRRPTSIDPRPPLSSGDMEP